MIQHIGLSISNITEVHNFYKKIMGFEKVKQFSMYPSIAEKVFGFEESPEVFIMKRDEMELELFLSNQKINQGWNHLCLTLSDAATIYQAAGKAGYPVVCHEGRNGFTYFIRDKQKNLFELKSRTP